MMKLKSLKTKNTTKILKNMEVVIMKNNETTNTKQFLSKGEEIFNFLIKLYEKQENIKIAYELKKS